MEVVGDYEYNKKDLIGHGAFAVVFKGRSRKRPDITVAIKSITKKNLAKSQNLLSKEIKILKELSDLHHDNVVALLDCKETTNHVYLVMEYCNGGDLADYLQVKGTLSEDTIASFLRQIAGAMKALNAKGIVHRDLKPQNLLLCYAGKSKNPVDMKLKIADFGFARFLQDGVMAATLCGSPMYMAPEVIMSLQYDAKADLWSIGTIVFQCLTGKAPFQAQTPQQLKHFYEKSSQLVPNIPPGTSSDLKDLLYKLLKRNAKDRIEFEDFFIHKFLKLPSLPASSPVPVPSASSSRHSISSSDSPIPPNPVSASPLSGNLQVSPSPKTKPLVKENVADMRTVSPEFGCYQKVGKDELDNVEDFVLVPEGMSAEHSNVDRRRKAPLAESELLESSREPVSLKKIEIKPSVGTVTYKKDDGDTSPPRPSTLQVHQPPSSSPSSEPIPVPSQVKAYQRMRVNSPSSPKVPSSEVATVSPKDMEQRGKPISRNNSENRLSGPDIGSLSPPSVQFPIGTPPNTHGQWRRSSGGTPPPNKYGNNTPPSGSPLKRSNTTPSRFSPLSFTGPASLPPIVGSPTKMPGGFAFPGGDEEMKEEPVHAPFGSHGHSNTVPDNMQALPHSENQVSCDMKRRDSEPMSGTSMLSERLYKAAFGNQNQIGGAVVHFNSGNQWSGSRENINGTPVDRERSASYYKRHSALMDSSPPSAVMYAQSPPNMEGPITFFAPPLVEETLMDDHHNEIIAKLSFVLDLVECIMELAQVKGGPLGSFTDSVNYRQVEGSAFENFPRFAETQRRLEQLVLYVRGLHLLSSALQLAKSEIKEEKLQPSNTLKSVVKQMNDHYHICVTECRQIHQRIGNACQAALTPQLVVATADKLIYNYSIELCQSAALDEIFGNPQECFRRYTVAQILLHSLAQQAKNIRDKELLCKYKESVERRLSNLQNVVFTS